MKLKTQDSENNYKHIQKFKKIEEDLKKKQLCELKKGKMKYLTKVNITQLNSYIESRKFV